MIRKSLLSVVTAVALQACATTTVTSPQAPAISDAALLSGEVLGWTSPSAPLPTREDAFGLDDAMRAFVASVPAGDPNTTANGLLDGMRDGGMLSLHYADDFTRTARATFHDRVGNCLSFTMLFVGLARAAGLDARYQLVDVPPTWSDDIGLVSVGKHINAIVATPPRAIVVDFNDEYFHEQYSTRIINDDYAAAFYYSNLGAEALGRRDNELSFALLTKAVRTYPDMAAAWVNLGVLYLRLQHLDYAEAALLRALKTDPREQSAFTNLESVYKTLGNADLAERYGAQIRQYREINPYYHYALARAAFNDKRYDDALASLRTAIRLKGDEDDFYSLQGQVFAALGRDEQAVESFARAKELATRQ
jgi:tetratricopeptide (TPR) repeat protein